MNGIFLRLALHAGDITLKGAWSEYDQHYFAVYRDLIARRPFYPALGGHDAAADPPQPYLDAFYLPQNGPAGLEERVYSFDWGNGHFVTLDTNAPYGPGSVQYGWLAKDLAASRRLWKFVVVYSLPYSSGIFGSDLGVREAWVTLFERYGVDIVFTARDHHYERTYPLIGGRPAQAAERGVIYIVTGGGHGQMPLFVGAGER